MSARVFIRASWMMCYNPDQRSGNLPQAAHSKRSAILADLCKNTSERCRSHPCRTCALSAERQHISSYQQPFCSSESSGSCHALSSFCTHIVCKVGRILICCTGAGTHKFQISSERVQYRLKWHVLGHIRPPSTLQNFQYSIETIFAF